MLLCQVGRCAHAIVLYRNGLHAAQSTDNFAEPTVCRRSAAAKAARKSCGLPIGRPRKLSGDKLALAERMRAGGEPVPVIAATLRVSVPTMYRLLAERSSKEEAS